MNSLDSLLQHIRWKAPLIGSDIASFTEEAHAILDQPKNPPSLELRQLRILLTDALSQIRFFYTSNELNLPSCLETLAQKVDALKDTLRDLPEIRVERDIAMLSACSLHEKTLKTSMKPLVSSLSQF